MYIETILHSFADLFSSGRSFVKVWLIFGALFVAACLYLLRHKFGGWEVKEVPRSVARNLFIVLSIVYLFSVVSTLYAYQRLGLSSDEIILAVSERNVSATHVFHSHVMKATFGVVSLVIPENLRLGFENGADFGVSYAKLFPVVGYAGLVLLAVLAFFSVRTLIHFAKSGRGFWSVALFTLSLAAAAKNAFDGGLFNHEAIPALVALWLLLYGHEKCPRNFLALSIAVIVPVTAVAVGLHFGAIPLFGAGESIRGFFGLLLVYVGWYALAEKCGHKLLASASVVIGVVVLASVLALGVQGVVYESTNLTGLRAFVATYGAFDKKIPAAVQVERIGTISIYSIESAATSGITIGDVMDLAGEPAAYMPVSIDTKSCSWTGERQKFAFTVFSRESLVIPQTKHRFAVIESFVPAGEHAGLYRYKAEVSTASCAPRVVSLLAELFKEAGAKDFILVSPVAGSKMTY